MISIIPMKKVPLIMIPVLFCFVLASLFATHPRRWVAATRAEFLEGKLRGVSVTSDGKLILAPAFEVVADTKEAFIYAAVLDRGGNLYLGTGNGGKLFRVNSAGESNQWAKLEEPGVFALAVDSSNRLYAGTGPDGKVYRINQGGEPETFFDPEEKYIWALTVDAQDNVFVATGPRGVIYKVTPAGKGETFYDSAATHIVSMAWDLDGNLLAGTASRALLLRISPKGSPFVLYDSPLEEIKSITVDRYGNIYAAALGGLGTHPMQATPPATEEKKDTSSTKKKGQRSSRRTVKVSGTEKGGKLEVYRIDKENLVDTLYSSDDELAFDLLVRSDGTLLVATGNKGRILSISPRRFATLLVECDEEQITRLLEHRGRFYAATSNLGKVFELQTKPATKGVYTSKVLDAAMLASWGTIAWELREPAAVGVRLFSRSGNTDTADQTWTEWEGPYEEPKGSHIKSPHARYLQWKIEFPEQGRAAAVISSLNAVDLVSVSYIQRNMAPQVTSITLHPPGAAFIHYPSSGNPGSVTPGGPEGAHLRSMPREIRSLGKPTTTTPPRRVYVPGAQSISWTARDANHDDLVFSLDYRAPGETKWKTLEKDLENTYYTLDGVSFPDGPYVVRVVASDRPSNPDDQVLEDELISKPFVIANSSPAVNWQSASGQGPGPIKFEASTRSSTIHQVEYSVDADDWRILFPEDGIADGTSEQFELKLKDLGAGDHVLTVRVVDSVGNIGTGKLNISIP